MIRAYFCTFTCYGFWLPNDQRGSGSVYVGSKALLKFGRATKVDTRRSVAWRRFDPVIRREAKASLKYPYVHLSGIQARSVALAFASACKLAGSEIFACAVLPDHVHLVVSRPPYPIEHLVTRLKGAATKRIQDEDLHPFQNYPMLRGRLPKMWGRGKWNIFLNDDEMIFDRIDYVQKNPVKQGLPRQTWSFVQPFHGWD